MSGADQREPAEGQVTDKDRLDALLQVWQQTVQVQQHFNDLEWRIRGLALTVVTLAIGAAGLAIQKDTRLTVLGLGLNASGLIILAAAFIWYAFYFVDKVWYHPLLIGSVKAGAQMETALQEHVPQAVLGSEISTASAVEPTKFTGLLKRSADADGVVRLHSGDKLRIFYWVVFVILLVLGLALLASRPVADSAPVPGVSPRPTASQGASTSPPSSPSASGSATGSTSRSSVTGSGSAPL